MSANHSRQSAKATARYCKTGDILVSSLTPARDKIAIADGDYMLTTAIFVLSDFADDEVRNMVYRRLRSVDVLKQTNALTDGFDVTYAKISEKNLYNNIFL